jgi:hypothetical protein
LQASYIPFHCVPIDVSPRGIEVVFSPFAERFPRLTSPKMRTLLDVSPVRTQRKSAPFRVGYLRYYGPIRPITGRHSLVPSSHTLCSVPLPYGRDTTCVGSIGLTQLLRKKSMEYTAGVCVPVGVPDAAAPSPLRRSYPHTILVTACQPLWPLGPSRDFTLTLHRCSALSSFPSPPPRRGWQRLEHGFQSFAPRITRPHVWIGTPGHHRAQSGSSSPCSILLHEPYEVQRMYVRSPPGHNGLQAGASRAYTQRL